MSEEKAGPVSKAKTYRVDLALKVMRSDPDKMVLWFTPRKKGVFIFRPSAIERIENLNDHFYSSFDSDHLSDLTKLLGGSCNPFRATPFELRGIMKDVLDARQR